MLARLPRQWCRNGCRTVGPGRLRPGRRQTEAASEPRNVCAAVSVYGRQHCGWVIFGFPKEKKGGRRLLATFPIWKKTNGSGVRAAECMCCRLCFRQATFRLDTMRLRRAYKGRLLITRTL